MAWLPSTFFSQNYEDLYLWRIFRDKPVGFYVDVGAHHPVDDSVTKIFYDQGWRGINIEPVPLLFNQLKTDRPRDVNLQIAIANNSGDAKLLIPPNSGCSHLVERSLSNSCSDSDLISVQVNTLFNVIASYSPPSIDFIKIDVEGYEAEVLEGLHLDRLPAYLRPVVIILEATMPNSRLSSPVRDRCSDILVNNEYSRFFFDGLNDYYCETSSADKFRGLMLPPNIFDVMEWGLRVGPECIRQLSRQNTELRESLDEFRLASRQIEDALSSCNKDQQDVISRLKLENAVLHAKYSDLRSETIRLLDSNSTLNAKSARQESKLTWLREQREELLLLLKKTDSKLAKIKKLMHRML